MMNTPNATLQAPPIAGARDERRLLAVACKRWLGQDFASTASLLLQLLLQRGEEAPVGPPGHDLLRGRLEHPDFVQTQGIKADRVFGAVVAPSPVGHLPHSLGGVLVVRGDAALDERTGHAFGLQRAD